METLAGDALVSGLLQIVESARDGMALLDGEHRFVYANPATCALLGVTADEVLGRDFLSEFPEWEREAVAERLGSHEPARWCSVHAVDLTECVIEYELRPHMTERGPAWILALRDLTEERRERARREEQRLKEEKLQEREEQYRSVFEAAGDGLVIHDAEGTIIEMNPAYFKMLGYSRDEVIGKHVSTLIPPEHHHLIAEGMQAIEAGDTPQARVAILRKDGTQLHVEGHGAAFELSGKPHYLGVTRDITERVRAEEELRRKEAEYRGVFESTGDGLIIGDAEGVVVEVNPAACRLYGYEHDEFVGISLSTLIHPDYRQQAVELARAIEAGGAVHAEEIALRKDGTSFQAEVRGTRFTYRGRPMRLAIVRDISERRKAEERLRESEEQYRGIFESSLDAISIVDMEGKLAEVNPAFCRLVGYSRDDLIGMPGTAVVQPDQHDVVAEAMQSIREGSAVHTELTMVHKNGTPVQVDGLATAFTFKGKPHFLGVSRDITERVQAEEQLREKESQYRSIFEATTDGLAILDTEGNFVEVNPAYCKLSGYSRDELIGMNTIALIHPDYRHLIAGSMQAITEGRDVWMRSVLVRKDGSFLHIEGGGTRFNYNGEHHFLGIARDITERLEAEKQLQEKEAQYRSIFEATTDGLGVLDMEGNVVEVNPAYCQMYGYDRDEVIGLHAFALMPPDYRHLLADGMQSIVSGNPVRVRSAGLRKDGTVFPVDGRGTTFLFNGKPHILGVSRDITEQVQAEKELREREAEYGAVFEATTDGLVVNDLETGVIVEANPAFCRMHGYTHGEMVGMHPSKHIHPDYHHLFAEYVRTAKDGDTFQAQAVDVRKNGTHFPVEVHGSAFTYKGAPHVLGVVRDITARVQAEEQLREREEQYRGIFESSADGLGIFDQEGFLVEANPALCRMLGYTHDELVGLHAGATLHPGYHHVIAEGLGRVNRDVPFRREIVLLRKDGTSFPVEAGATTFAYRGAPHELVVLRDMSERVEAENQIRQREAEYRGIFEATNDGLMISDLDGYIVEANPRYCQMFGYTREEVIGLHSTALAAPESRHTIDESVQTLATADAYNTVAQAQRKDGSTFFAEARAARFTYRGRPHYLSVVQDVTERVRAYEIMEQRVEERTRELSTLLDVSHNVSSTLELRPLMEVILDQLEQVVDYAGASISLIEADESRIVAFRGAGSAVVALDVRFPLQQSALFQRWQGKVPLIINDVRHDDTPEAIAFREDDAVMMDGSFSYVRSWMAVPMVVNERLVGILTLNGAEPGLYTPHHAELILGIASQAAIAIENARLYQKAQEVAALEERQRLARELHDSVSQALFAIGLAARTARTLLDRDVEQAAQSIDYVHSLARSGMAEMRALIFELRPESLEMEGLVQALTKQADAVKARYEILVNLTLCDEPDLPLPQKEALYRIAQEALHNVVKHAQATQVQLSLLDVGGELTLEIRDDGTGFDPAGTFPGHLGLSSMRERVERLGGTLEVESAANTGTMVRARLP